VIRGDADWDIHLRVGMHCLGGGQASLRYTQDPCDRRGRPALAGLGSAPWQEAADWSP